MGNYLTIADLTARIPTRHLVQLLEENDDDAGFTELTTAMNTRLDTIITSIESRIDNILGKEYELPLEITDWAVTADYTNAINVVKELTLGATLYELYSFQQNDKVPEKFTDIEMKLRAIEDGKQKIELRGISKIAKAGIGTHYNDRVFTDTLQGLY